MYGFMRERRWLLGLVLVLAVAAVCASLGFWQLRRLHAAEARHRLTAAREHLPVAELTSGMEPASAAERRVSATGRFDRPGEIVLAARSFEGQPGRHLLTPLTLDDGTVVIVDRGWIPEETDPSAAAPPQGTTEVSGVLLPMEERGLLTPEPKVTRRRTLARIDLEAIRRDLTGRSVYPLFLLLETQSPPQGDLPLPIPRPRRDDPPHLSYAVQWFLFAATALVVYGALVRREARERADPDDATGSGTVERPAAST